MEEVVKVTLGEKEYELRNNLFMDLAAITGHELKNAIIEDADGNQYRATICEDMGWIYIVADGLVKPM